MRCLFSALLILVSLIIAIDTGYARNQVKAEGMATINQNRTDIARDKAIDNAQRSAVEKAMGVMISSSSEVENYQLKVDRILSESRGFISSYHILSEERKGNEYSVTIDADIGVGKLKDRMAAMNLIMARKSKPRLMIIFNRPSQKDFIAEDVLTRFLLAKGFKLVDSDSVRKNTMFDPLLLNAADRDTLARLSHQYGAEVLLQGSVEISSNSFTMSGIEMHTNKVIVSMKAINVDTGDVIASESETGSAPGLKDDVKSITEEATSKLAKRLVDDIFERWSAELANTMTVKLYISGLATYHELVKLKECLPEVIKGYRELHQRSYSRGTAELDLEVRGNIQGVVDDLAVVALDKKQIRISGITSNRIEASF